MKLNDLQSAICDVRDVLCALSEETLNSPKDNDGTDITIRDCLEDVIRFLSEAENEYE